MEDRLFDYIRKIVAPTQDSRVHYEGCSIQNGDHNYSKPWHCHPDVYRVQPCRTFAGPPREADNEDELDVDTVSEDLELPFDSSRTKIALHESIPIAKAIVAESQMEREDIGEDGTPPLKPFWSKLQRRLVDVVWRAVHCEYVERLVYTGQHLEPVIRRENLSNCARQIRTELSYCKWDIVLLQWMHHYMLDKLPETMLACYLDILQLLHSKIPLLVERSIILRNVISNDMTPARIDAQRYMLKRPWDPDYHLAKTAPLHHKLPENPILLLVPSSPGPPWAQRSSRLKRWQIQFSNMATIVPLGVALGSRDRESTSINCLQVVVSCVYARLTELGRQYPNRPIVLVGWRTGALLSLHLSQVVSVAAVIALGLPMRHIYPKSLKTKIHLAEKLDIILDTKTPTLFIVGGNAAAIHTHELDELRQHLWIDSSLIVISGGDDFLRISSDRRKRLGFTQGMLDRALQEAIGEFLSTTLSKPPSVRPPPKFSICPKSRFSAAVKVSKQPITIYNHHKSTVQIPLQTAASAVSLSSLGTSIRINGTGTRSTDKPPPQLHIPSTPIPLPTTPSTILADNILMPPPSSQRLKGRVRAPILSLQMPMASKKPVILRQMKSSVITPPIVSTVAALPVRQMVAPVTQPILQTALSKPSILSAVKPPSATPFVLPFTPPIVQSFTPLEKLSNPIAKPSITVSKPSITVVQTYGPSSVYSSPSPVTKLNVPIGIKPSTPITTLTNHSLAKPSTPPPERPSSPPNVTLATFSQISSIANASTPMNILISTPPPRPPTPIPPPMVTSSVGQQGIGNLNGGHLTGLMIPVVQDTLAVTQTLEVQSTLAINTLPSKTGRKDTHQPLLDVIYLGSDSDSDENTNGKATTKNKKAKKSVLVPLARVMSNPRATNPGPSKRSQPWKFSDDEDDDYVPGKKNRKRTLPTRRSSRFGYSVFDEDIPVVKENIGKRRCQEEGKTVEADKTMEKEKTVKKEKLWETVGHQEMETHGNAREEIEKEKVADNEKPSESEADEDIEKEKTVEIEQPLETDAPKKMENRELEETEKQKPVEIEKLLETEAQKEMDIEPHEETEKEKTIENEKLSEAAQKELETYAQKVIRKGDKEHGEEVEKEVENGVKEVERETQVEIEKQNISETECQRKESQTGNEVKVQEQQQRVEATEKKIIEIVEDELDREIEAIMNGTTLVKLNKVTVNECNKAKDCPPQEKIGKELLKGKEEKLMRIKEFEAIMNGKPLEKADKIKINEYDKTKEDPPEKGTEEKIMISEKVSNDVPEIRLQKELTVNLTKILQGSVMKKFGEVKNKVGEAEVMISNQEKKISSDACAVDIVMLPETPVAVQKKGRQQNRDTTPQSSQAISKQDKYNSPKPSQAEEKCTQHDSETIDTTKNTNKRSRPTRCSVDSSILKRMKHNFQTNVPSITEDSTPTQESTDISMPSLETQTKHSSCNYESNTTKHSRQTRVNFNSPLSQSKRSHHNSETDPTDNLKHGKKTRAGIKSSTSSPEPQTKRSHQISESDPTDNMKCGKKTRASISISSSSPEHQTKRSRPNSGTDATDNMKRKKTRASISSSRSSSEPQTKRSNRNTVSDSTDTVKRSKPPHVDSESLTPSPVPLKKRSTRNSEADATNTTKFSKSTRSNVDSLTTTPVSQTKRRQSRNSETDATDSMQRSKPTRASVVGATPSPLSQTKRLSRNSETNTTKHIKPTRTNGDSPTLNPVLETKRSSRNSQSDVADTIKQSKAKRGSVDGPIPAPVPQTKRSSHNSESDTAETIRISKRPRPAVYYGSQH